jgi:uncharacterized membrane protein YjjP (DUF1212 family)
MTPPPPPTAPRPGTPPEVIFALALARALLSWGMPAHRVEESLLRLGRALDFTVDVSSQPTSLFATLEVQGQVETRIVRVEPGGTDLERLSSVHELVGQVERRELTPSEAARRLAAVVAAPPRYALPLQLLAFSATSGSAAVLLGADAVGALVATGLGLLVGLLDTSPFGALDRLVPAATAALVTVVIGALSAAGLALSPPLLIVAAAIVLLPGLTLTTAVVELATANLVSGTARLMGGATTFLQLIFGVALGRALVAALPEGPPPPVEGLPGPALLLALPVGAAGLTAILRARPRDVPWILLVCGVAVGASRLGAPLGAELGAFVAAFAVAVTAYAFARWRDRPASVLLVPGVLLLVPGSVGFLSLHALLEHDVSAAVQTMFRMFMVTMALAAGVLSATAVRPTRGAL